MEIPTTAGAGPHGSMLRQGSVVTVQSVADIMRTAGIELPPLPANSVAVVLSQTCDLQHRDPAVELDAELWFGELQAGAPDRQNGKTYRRFALALVGAAPHYVQIKRGRIVYLPRQALLRNAALHPQQPDQAAQRALSHWLGQRYTRQAFPDAFVTAVQQVNAHTAVQKACAQLDGCTGLYFLLNSFEELDIAQYRIGIVLLMHADATHAAMAQANAALTQIESALELTGMTLHNDLDFLGVTKESDLYASDLRMLVRWDLDYLTVRGEPSQDDYPICS